MDVVVTPMGDKGTSWSLKDRLGRPLGTIEKTKPPEGFEIFPEAGKGLKDVPRRHASLNEVMAAVSKHMNGACNLDSQDWD